MRLLRGTYPKLAMAALIVSLPLASSAFKKWS